MLRSGFFNIANGYRAGVTCQMLLPDNVLFRPYRASDTGRFRRFGLTTCGGHLVGVKITDGVGPRLATICNFSSDVS